LGKPWAPEGVTGFAECSFKDTSNLEGVVWKENAPNWYRFTVMEGKVREVGKSMDGAQVKSFKVPKGFKVEYKGMFLRNKYDFHLTQQQTDKIKDIKDYSFAKSVSTWTDESCAINFDFWYMNMQVSSQEYIKIARSVPFFLKESIEAQKLSIKKSEVTQELETYDNNRKKEIKLKEEIEIKVTEITKRLNDMRITLASYTKTYTELKIKVEGQINSKEWIDGFSGTKEEIERLEQEIRVLEKKIEDILINIKKYEAILEQLKKEKYQYDIEIKNRKEQITRLETETQEIIRQSTTSTEEINKLTESINKKVSENENLKNTNQNNLDEIKRLQKEIQDNERKIINNKSEIDTLTVKLTTKTDEKDKIIIRKTKKTTEITTITEEITKFTKQISVNDQSIEDYTKKIQSSNIDIVHAKDDIARKREEIKSKRSLAERKTRESFENEMNLLLVKIEKLKGEILILENEERTERSKQTKITVEITTIESSEIRLKRSELSQLTTEFESRKQKALQEFNKIRDILFEQSELLMEVMKFSSLKIESWTFNSKQTVFKYLQLIPGNPTPLFSMDRRRRRLRRYRRRFY